MSFLKSHNPNFVGCLNPVYITDLKRGGKQPVKCGKCAYCLTIRQYELIGRVEREHLNPNNKLCLFVTLDYNNDNVPRYFYDPNRSLWYSTRSDVKDSKGFSRYPTLDASHVEEFYNLVGLENRKTFGHLCSADLSYYFNTLNDLIHKDIKRKKTNLFNSYDEIKFRYFACGEYGPTTFRPHYHAILWFPQYYSFEQQHYIEQKLLETWTFGSVEIDAVTDGGVNRYLSSYVNSVSNLPEVLKRKHLRPFCIFSKMPVIGSYNVDEEEIYKILTTGTIDRSKYNFKTKEHDDDPLSLTFFRRYFPKCRGYSYFDLKKRIYVYSYAYNYIRDYWKPSEIEKIKSFKDFDKIKLSDIDFPIVYNERLGIHEDMPYQDKHASLVCAMYCIVFGFTPEYVLRAFDTLYSKISLKRLKSYFEMQSQMYENQNNTHNTHSDEIV